jgi:hypothetical protein
VAEIAEAPGRAPHMVWRCFAGLEKKGAEVSVQGVVRQVGPNKEGAKGNFTIHRVAG